jgi:hypothetical protein
MRNVPNLIPAIVHVNSFRSGSQQQLNQPAASSLSSAGSNSNSDTSSVDALVGHLAQLNRTIADPGFHPIRHAQVTLNALDACEHAFRALRLENPVKISPIVPLLESQNAALRIVTTQYAARNRGTHLMVVVHNLGPLKPLFDSLNTRPKHG